MRLFLLALAGLLLTGCHRVADEKAPVVLAASSLTEALGEAADGWAAQGNPRPMLSFAASSALARQLEQGAPADLFISADEQWMDRLERADLLQPDSRADLLGNRLVLIAPADSEIAVDLDEADSLAAALGDGRLAMADPAAVPAGKYGKQALSSLGQWRSVEPRIAAAENVRAALALVERGAAPLGIVYATDAAASAKVRVVAVFPAASHRPIRYPAALLAAQNRAAAADFLAFLQGPQARAIFRRHGFAAP